jgi:hypothetical protein
MIAPVTVVGTASPGNAARDFERIQADVDAKLLAIVHERVADATTASINVPIAFPMAGYRAAIPPSGWVSTDELHAASDAYEHRADYLLVPAIAEWTQMRTDDPIGAFILPHNSVGITLRLMRMRPPALVAAASFHNHAHLTLNQAATRLLDGRFRRMVLQLLEG